MHSAGFADATRDAPRRPGRALSRAGRWPTWSRHLTEVHWFWATIVEERLAAPPDAVPPSRPGADDDRAGRRLRDRGRPAGRGAPRGRPVRLLLDLGRLEAGRRLRDPPPGAGGGGAPLGRGARRRRDAGASTPAVAADSVEEFLHFSVASDDDPDDPTSPPLDGHPGLPATDTGDAWTLTDGARPGTAQVARALGRRRAGGRGDRRGPAAVALRPRRARHRPPSPTTCSHRFRAHLLHRLTGPGQPATGTAPARRPRPRR